MKQSHPNQVGRPPVVLSREKITELLSLDLSYTQIARVLGVSRTTLYKKMTDLGITHKAKYSTITDEQLDNTIKNIYRDQHSMGEIMLMGHLKSRGLDVQRSRL